MADFDCLCQKMPKHNFKIFPNVLSRAILDERITVRPPTVNIVTWSCKFCPKIDPL